MRSQSRSPLGYRSLADFISQIYPSVGWSEHRHSSKMGQRIAWAWHGVEEVVIVIPWRGLLEEHDLLLNGPKRPEHIQPGPKRQ